MSCAPVPCLTTAPCTTAAATPIKQLDAENEFNFALPILSSSAPKTEFDWLEVKKKSAEKIISKKEKKKEDKKVGVLHAIITHTISSYQPSINQELYH